MSLVTLALLTLLSPLSGLSSLPARDRQQDPPLRVAVVRLTHTHVHWLLGRPDRGDVQVVGVYEPDEDLAGRYLKQHGLASELHYVDLGDMLKACDPEAVVLFGSTQEHLEHTLLAAQHGLHVMVEKPLALDYASAQRMAQATREAGVELLTNYETTWYRTNATIAALLLTDDGFGPLRRAVFRTGHPGPIEIGCNAEFLEWLTDPEFNGGGALPDFGCYGANLMTAWMNGRRPERVSAVTRRQKPELYPQVEDDATITVDYGAAVAVIQASWCWPHNVKDAELYGDRSELRASGGDRLVLREGDAQPRELTLEEMAPHESDPFAHLAAVVRGRCRPNALSSLENNLIVMEILDAARESARTGKTIELER